MRTSRIATADLATRPSLTIDRRALDVLIVALLVVAGWLAYTALTEQAGTVPTYNNQPGHIVPSQPNPTQEETPRYV